MGGAGQGPGAVLRTYLDDDSDAQGQTQRRKQCRIFPRCGPRYKDAHSQSPPGAALGPSPGVRRLLHSCCHGHCHCHCDGEPGTLPSLIMTAYPRRVDVGAFRLSPGALGCLPAKPLSPPSEGSLNSIFSVRAGKLWRKWGLLWATSNHYTCLSPSISCF